MHLLYVPNEGCGYILSHSICSIAQSLSLIWRVFVMLNNVSDDVVDDVDNDVNMEMFEMLLYTIQCSCGFSKFSDWMLAKLQSTKLNQIFRWIKWNTTSKLISFFDNNFPNSYWIRYFFCVKCYCTWYELLPEPWNLILFPAIAHPSRLHTFLLSFKIRISSNLNIICISDIWNMLYTTMHRNRTWQNCITISISIKIVFIGYWINGRYFQINKKT